MKHYPSLALLLVVVAACGKDAATTEPTPTGSLSGTVEVWSTLPTLPGLHPLADASGVAVQVEGTSFADTSDASGRWTIPDLPAGTYILRYSKPGFGHVREFGVNHMGGGPDYRPARITITRIPDSATVTDLRSTTIDTTYGTPPNVVERKSVTLKARVSGAHVYYFLGATPEVSLDPTTHRMSRSGTYLDGDIATTDISITELYQAGFSRGDTAYAIGYPGYYGKNTSYFDPSIGVTVVTSLRAMPSNVVTVIVP